MTDLFSIKGKVAVVTGGTRGIGMMIARGFVEAGAKVYISSRKADACAAAEAELSKLGQCVAIPADLSTESECVRLAEEIGKREEAVHVLVNNAGATWGAPLKDFPDSGWDKVMNINVKGVFNLTKHLLPKLEAAAKPGDPARIINIGSIDGIKPPVFENFSYSASKAAVHHMTVVLAKQFAPKITVNAIAPGPFESKMTAFALDAIRSTITQTCPMERIGEPDDMAGTAIFLSSKAAAYITGTIIPVDGGIATTR